MEKPKGSERWAAEVEALEAKAPKNGHRTGILFFGSSTFRLWAELEKSLHQFDAVNNGFGGARVVDLHYYANRLIPPWNPKHIVLYGGGNDVQRGASGEDVAKNYALLIDKVRKLAPSAKITVMTVLPHPAFQNVYSELIKLNQYSVKLADDFIDTWQPLMAMEPNKMLEYFQDDLIHLNQRGYDWLLDVVIKHL